MDTDVDVDVEGQEQGRSRSVDLARRGEPRGCTVFGWQTFWIPEFDRVEMRVCECRNKNKLSKLLETCSDPGTPYYPPKSATVTDHARVKIILYPPPSFRPIIDILRLLLSPRPPSYSPQPPPQVQSHTLLSPPAHPHQQDTAELSCHSA